MIRSNPQLRIGQVVFGLAVPLLLSAMLALPYALAQVAGPPNADVTIIAPIPGEGVEVNTLSGDVAGGVIYSYIGVVFTWVAGIAGLVLLCFVVFYGFLLMFAGIEDHTEEAKKGLTASLGGLILLMCSGLLLYTLNPNFFGGFGDDMNGGVILGTKGGGYTEPTTPTDPTEPTEPTDPKEPGTPAPVGSCAKVRETPCTNISSRTKQLAQQILDSKAIAMDTGSTLLPGSGPRQNLQDLVKGMCPLVQDYSNATKSCEKDTAKINAEVANAEKILSAILAIPKGSIKSIYITSLFGGTHAAGTHRRFQAADIGIVNGWTVANSTDAKVCTFAKTLRDNTSAPTVFGPFILGKKNECGDNIGFCAGHNNHFHVDVKGVSCGGVRYLQGTSEEVEFESAQIDLFE